MYLFSMKKSDGCMSLHRLKNFRAVQYQHVGTVNYYYAICYVCNHVLMLDEPVHDCDYRVSSHHPNEC